MFVARPYETRFPARLGLRDVLVCNTEVALLVQITITIYPGCLHTDATAADSDLSAVIEYRDNLARNLSLIGNPCILPCPPKD
jgi:hypothetical protein